MYLYTETTRCAVLGKRLFNRPLLYGVSLCICVKQTDIRTREESVESVVEPRPVSLLLELLLNGSPYAESEQISRLISLRG